MRFNLLHLFKKIFSYLYKTLSFILGFSYIIGFHWPSFPLCTLFLLFLPRQSPSIVRTLVFSYLMFLLPSSPPFKTSFFPFYGPFSIFLTYTHPSFHTDLKIEI